MGVRGLTSYIARHADLYLAPFELHDCNLVIDGDNLACNLYKNVTGTCSAFGGDYDDFFRSVIQFVAVLSECNIRPYVLMDGGYERRKLHTVNKRMRGKISGIKKINPCGSIPVFPLMLKEVFVDALRQCKVSVMRCIFEADDELAALSRKLNCPLLSYDSDFYIYNVIYIPLVTLTIKAHTKLIKANDTKEADLNAKLHKHEAKSVEKRTKSNCVLKEIVVDNVDKRTRKYDKKTYKYLDCCVYRIEHLIARNSLSQEKLPLFAALLGNDYIARSSFKNFMLVGMGKTGRSRKMKQQQKRIKFVLQWLKQETTESALNKILTRLKMDKRTSLLAQVEGSISGYSNEQCYSYDYILQHYNDVCKDETDTDDEMHSENCTQEHELRSSNDNVFSDDSDDGIEHKNAENDDEIEFSDASDVSSDNTENFIDDDNVTIDTTKIFPTWFLSKLFAADLPRYFVDLVYLKKYFNNPQIENFLYDDAHEIAIPILVYIYTLLNSVECEDNGKLRKCDEFTYVTRTAKATDIRYYRYGADKTFKYTLDPNDSNNIMLFKNLFEKELHKVNVHELFTSITILPDDLQLYFLSIIYLLDKSTYCNFVHIHALIICIVVLRTIDTNIPPERDLKAFQKRFGKIIKKERIIRTTESLKGVKRTIRDDLKCLSVPDRMAYIPKSDCYLVQDNILKHFHIQETFKKKYDNFSTTVLHGFAQFQSVAFQLHSLNALLNYPFVNFQMGKLYSGVFLYNIYDLLRNRKDICYYIENFIFQDSPMMFNFYCFLMDWCIKLVPHLSRQNECKSKIRKQKQKNCQQESENTFDETNEPLNNSDDDFFDINNRFCSVLNVK